MSAEKVTLRPYQQRALDELYDWFADETNTGNPCLVLPTGSGKSHIIAAFCHETLTQWPDESILMLTHVKELIEQNAKKLYEHWPHAPLSIYSASVGKKQTGTPIMFAGIQSVRKNSALIGHVDIVIIDECHLISHNDEGGYRTLISELRVINPRLRVIGLTATPWRLGHGVITDKTARSDEPLFSALIEPVGILELVNDGYLAPLRNKGTEIQIDLKKISKKMGEYDEKSAAAVLSDGDINKRICKEIIDRAGEARHWLIFCSGVDHARVVANELLSQGIYTKTISGKTPKNEREQILESFANGDITAITNANILTTGYDNPLIDLIVFLRPTMSPTLYVQMAGRGLRIKPHTNHCKILDFVGLVEQHGPITDVRPPGPPGEVTEPPPTKECPNCHEIVGIKTMACPDCGHEFEPAAVDDRQSAAKPPALHDEIDIMGLVNTVEIESWRWRAHTSRAGNKGLQVTYYGPALSSQPHISQYYNILAPGYIGNKHRRDLATVAINSKCYTDGMSKNDDLDMLITQLNRGYPPKTIGYTKEGNFYSVKAMSWE